MFHIIFDNYFKELSTRKLLYEYSNKKKIKISYLFSFILFCAMLYATIDYKLLFKHILVPFIFPFFIFLSGLPTFLIINIEYKIVLKKRYNIDSKHLWNIVEFHRIKKQKFKDFLIANKIITNENKFNYLISLIDEKLADSKTPYFINTSIVVAILLPVWTQFVMWVYQKRVVTGTDALFILFLTIWAVSLVIISIHSLKTIIYDDFVNAYYNKLKKLRTVLRELYFENMKS
jgi:hypothetical protein